MLWIYDTLDYYFMHILVEIDKLDNRFLGGKSKASLQSV